MIQPLHIFRKDVRHLWPEIALHTALLIGFAWIIPQAWPGNGEIQTPLNLVSVLLRAMLPILWLVLIARLIHDEALVGDQQFWLTRPYTWPALLAAKLLFLVALVFVLFLVMQCYLLAHAGLNPLASIPGLLLNLLHLVLLCFLPFTALAAVTSTFSRFAFTVTASILYLVGVALVFAHIAGTRTMPTAGSVLIVTLFTLLCVGIVVYQYASRRTTTARIALAATPIILMLFAFLLPASALYRHAYPLASDATDAGAARLTFDPDPLQQQPAAGAPFHFESNVEISIPIKSINPTFSAEFEGRAMAFTLDGPGIHYTSHWQNAGLDPQRVLLTLPDRVMQRVRNTPVRVQVVLAGERFHPAAPHSLSLTQHFSAPGGGVCVFGRSEFDTAPVCRFALHNPAIQVSGIFSTKPCFLRPSGSGGNGGTRSGFVRIRATQQTPFFDPVVQHPIVLRDPQADPSRPASTFLCAGAPVTLTPLKSVGNLRFEFDTPPLLLGAYLLRDPQQ
jgi:hypothetical protein